MTDFGYRTREEVDAWKQRCPIARCREALLEAFAEEESDPAWLNEVEEQIAAEVQRANDIALAADYPSADDAKLHVYATPSAPRHPSRFQRPPSGRADPREIVRGSNG